MGEQAPRPAPRPRLDEPDECSGWAPSEGRWRGKGSSCQNWGEVYTWCYVKKDYHGCATPFLKPSPFYPGQYVIPCDCLGKDRTFDWSPQAAQSKRVAHLTKSAGGPNNRAAKKVNSAMRKVKAQPAAKAAQSTRVAHLTKSAGGPNNRAVKKVKSAMTPSQAGKAAADEAKKKGDSKTNVVAVVAAAAMEAAVAKKIPASEGRCRGCACGEKGRWHP